MKKTLFLFFITVCLLPRAHTQPNPSTGTLGDTSRVVVLQRDSLHPISLSQQNIAIAEKVLNKALEQEMGQGKKQKGVDIKQYYIQLLPRMNEKGELEIWVNCFCESVNTWFDWRKKVFSRHLVMDGGNRFFDFVINVEQENYHDFGVNGVG